MTSILERAATVLVLLLPVFLTHGRALADIDLSVLAALFVVRSARGGGWAWVGTAWFRIGIAWWVWLVVCSTPGVADRGHGGWGSFGQAVATARFLVLAAALEWWVLAERRRVRRLGQVLAAVAAYIAAQVALAVRHGAQSLRPAALRRRVAHRAVCASAGGGAAVAAAVPGAGAVGRAAGGHRTAHGRRGAGCRRAAADGADGAAHCRCC